MLLVVFIPEVGFESIGGELEGVGREPRLVAAAILLGHGAHVKRREMPLAVIGGVVAGIVEVIRNRGQIEIHRGTVAPHIRVGGVHTGLQAGARRTADGLAGEAVDDVRAFFGEAVEIWRQSEWRSVGTGGVETLLISEKDDDVGASVRHQFGFHAACERRQA